MIQLMQDLGTLVALFGVLALIAMGVIASCDAFTIARMKDEIRLKKQILDDYEKEAQLRIVQFHDYRREINRLNVELTKARNQISQFDHDGDGRVGGSRKRPA